MKPPTYAESRAPHGELELARVSDTLADLSRDLAPVAVEKFIPLENALSDWRTPRNTADLDRAFLLFSAPPTRISEAIPSATPSTGPWSPTLPRACVSGSLGLQPRRRFRARAGRAQPPARLSERAPRHV